MTEPAMQAGAQPEILIVEDTPVEAELLRRSLDRAGYRVTLAKNGEEGLQAARARRPALVVSDIRMPLMNGYQLCHEIKHDEALWNVPVILLTVLFEPEDIMEAINAGADSYVIKPFVEASLLERIRALLATPISRKRTEERRTEKVEYDGKRYAVTGGGQQMLSLLLSVYKNTLAQNRELINIQTQLNLLNDSLDDQVRERTAALAASEERFRNAVETVRDAFIIVEGEGGTIRGWNPAAEALFGYTKEEATGRAIHDFLPPPRFHEAARRGMEHFAATGEGAAIGKTLELAALRRDGTEFPIELSLSAMRINGKWHATGIVRDISERKRAENMIKASEERYRQLFESMSSGVAIYQPDAACEVFTFKSANRAVERIEQVKREEVLGRSVEEVFPGVRAFGLLAVFQRVCRSGGAEHFPAAFYQDERISGWRDNYVYRLDSGEIVAVYDDVTERVERETQIAGLNIALRTLSTCNGILIHAQTEEDLFREVCRHIVEIGGYLLAWAEYPGEGGGAPRLGAHFGDEALYRLHAELAPRPEHASHCLTAAALRTRQTQVCNKLQEMPECGFDPLREAGVRSILALPLLHNADLHGALTIFSPEPDAFDPGEVRLMEELAADLAYGVASLRIRAERDRSTVMLRQALEETIAAIALTLEKRDPYTAGHQQRVAGIASAIATEMGLSPPQIEGIHFGALIHDIGKVYAPAEILNRPGKLSELEFGLIKTHPQVGFDIVKDIPFPWPVAQMVHQHHERLDGSGYPQGLKGEEIILEARILAVADVVEAMMAHRPYRAALGMEAAMTEVKRGRGTAYDPAAVDACLRLFQQQRLPPRMIHPATLPPAQ